MATARLLLLFVSITLYTYTGLSATVRLTDSIKSSTISINCAHRGDILLAPGNTHDWTSVDTREIFYCVAFWTSTNKFASFHGYEPSRDGGRNVVFWVVREDGFYVSADGKSGWKREAEWESEIVA